MQNYLGKGKWKAENQSTFQLWEECHPYYTIEEKLLKLQRVVTWDLGRLNPSDTEGKSEDTEAYWPTFCSFFVGSWKKLIHVA